MATLAAEREVDVSRSGRSKKWSEIHRGILSNRWCALCKCIGDCNAGNVLRFGVGTKHTENGCGATFEHGGSETVKVVKSHEERRVR